MGPRSQGLGASQAMVDAQAAMGSVDEGMRLAMEQQRRFKGLKATRSLRGFAIVAPWEPSGVS